MISKRKSTSADVYTATRTTPAETSCGKHKDDVDGVPSKGLSVVIAKLLRRWSFGGSIAPVSRGTATYGQSSARWPMGWWRSALACFAAVAIAAPVAAQEPIIETIAGGGGDAVAEIGRDPSVSTTLD